MGHVNTASLSSKPTREWWLIQIENARISPEIQSLDSSPGNLIMLQSPPMHQALSHLPLAASNSLQRTSLPLTNIQPIHYRPNAATGNSHFQLLETATRQLSHRTKMPLEEPTASKHTKLTCLLPKRTLASLSNIELFFIGQFECYNFEDLLYFFEWIEVLLYRLVISPHPQDHTHSMIEPSFEGLVIQPITPPHTKFS